MTDDLPESLAAKPNIPWSLQTLEQLRQERDYWDRKITLGGAAGFAAAEFKRECARWIARRE